MSSVFIVGQDYEIRDMFVKRGWTISTDPFEADLVQFTGGEDVDPSLYGEERHATTYSNPKRDALESSLFRSLDPDQAKAGICRGAQFLNVMSGGRMWQNVDGHIGSHRAYTMDGTYDFTDGEKLYVTSTHHQMMRPSREAVELVYAYEARTLESSNTHYTIPGLIGDVECVYYPDTNSLCYQPHPEYVDIGDPCQELYFKLIEDYLEISEEDF